MNNVRKRVISVVCAAALLCTICPLVASATAPLGDINGDGAVTTTDAHCALLSLATEEALPPSADLNDDGTVNTLDVRLLLLCVLSGETTDPVTVKTGTYNIANGRDTHWDFSLIAQDIVDNDLDIVGIQEVDRFCYRSNKVDTLALLKEYTGMPYGAFFKCIDFGGGEYGTAILSKYPLLKTEEWELNDGSVVERRLLTHAKIYVGGTAINFFNTHLTVASDDIRADELQQIKKRLAGVDNTILVGDFNVNAYTEFDVLASLSCINNPETNYITFPKEDKPIDNICYAQAFRPVADGHGMYQQYHSDHALLYAAFEMNKD